MAHTLSSISACSFKSTDVAAQGGEGRGGEGGRQENERDVEGKRGGVVLKARHDEGFLETGHGDVVGEESLTLNWEDHVTRKLLRSSSGRGMRGGMGVEWGRGSWGGCLYDSLR